MTSVDDSLLTKYGLSPGTPPKDGLDEQDLRPENYKAFGIDTAGGAARVLAVFVTRVDRFLRGGWAYCIAGPRSARVFSRSLRRVDLLPFEKA